MFDDDDFSQSQFDSCEMICRAQLHFFKLVTIISCRGQGESFTVSNKSFIGRIPRIILQSLSTFGIFISSTLEFLDIIASIVLPELYSFLCHRLYLEEVFIDNIDYILKINKNRIW